MHPTTKLTKSSISFLDLSPLWPSCPKHTLPVSPSFFPYLQDMSNHSPRTSQQQKEGNRLQFTVSQTSQPLLSQHTSQKQRFQRLPTPRLSPTTNLIPNQEYQHMIENCPLNIHYLILSSDLLVQLHERFDTFSCCLAVLVVDVADAAPPL